MRTVRFLFNDDMARAVVQGRKTVTRRPVISRANGPVINDEHVRDRDGYPDGIERAVFQRGDELMGVAFPCAPGVLLIGRECVSFIAHGPEYGCRARYRADGVERVFDPAPDAKLKYRPVDGWKCVPSVHMPDWAARIRRRVVSVTVDRVQSITEADAVREGCLQDYDPSWRNNGAFARGVFIRLWDGIYGKRGLGWDTNPWVWRIEFGAENVEGEK